MKTINKVGSAIGVAALLALGGCGTAPANTGNVYYPQATSNSGAYASYGVVQSIEMVRQNTGIGGSGIGAGAIVGAVVGGLVGNQVGGGTGKTAATVVGAAGGAYAGNELEKRNQQADAYQFTIRMNDGSRQTVTQTTIADIRVGDRVKIENGVARRY